LGCLTTSLINAQGTKLSEAVVGVSVDRAVNYANVGTSFSQNSHTEFFLLLALAASLTLVAWDA